MKYLISIVSKDKNFMISEEDVMKFQQLHPDSAIETVPDNRENITVVSNRQIEKAISGGYDFLVCMHSDVWVDLNKLAIHIEECKDRYDVMGLCGCEKISVSESPLNWFCGSRKYPEYRWGCVCHGELGNSVSFFSQGRPETLDHQVSCIDGLCMIFSRAALEKGLRFDEELRFNCYDTQISFDAVLTHRLRLGCLVETELRHFSVGKSILGDDFLKDEIVLRKRFGFEIPKDSRLEKYLTNQNKNVIISA